MSISKSRFKKIDGIISLSSFVFDISLKTGLIIPWSQIV